MTGPVERFAGQIASHGYVVGMPANESAESHLKYPACPSSFHEFEGPEPIPYDTEGRVLCLLGAKLTLLHRD